MTVQRIELLAGLGNCQALLHPTTDHTTCRFGSKSQRGTEIAAIFYTLFEAAKLSGTGPRAHVTRAASRAIQDPGAVTLPSDLT